MSVLTARYAGTCTACGAATEAGDRVRWTRGQGVRHATTEGCASAVDYAGTSCCGDYHYADCPTRTGGVSDYHADNYQEEGAWW
jgi:hypothetical protein